MNLSSLSPNVLTEIAIHFSALSEAFSRLADDLQAEMDVARALDAARIRTLTDILERLNAPSKEEPDCPFCRSFLVSSGFDFIDGNFVEILSCPNECLPLLPTLFDESSFLDAEGCEQ